MPQSEPGFKVPSYEHRGCNKFIHNKRLHIHLYFGNQALYPLSSRWRHQMETFSALLAICAGNSPVPDEFPAQWPVTRSFDVFFHLRLNKRLSKHAWGWWFETLSRPLWRHRNVLNDRWCRCYFSLFMQSWQQHLPQRAHNNNVFMTSKRRRRRRFDVMKTLSLRHYCVMCPLGRNLNIHTCGDMPEYRRQTRSISSLIMPCTIASPDHS